LPIEYDVVPDEKAGENATDDESDVSEGALGGVSESVTVANCDWMKPSYARYRNVSVEQHGQRLYVTCVTLFCASVAVVTEPTVALESTELIQITPFSGS
jgi:hypothetical protein